MEIIYQTGIGLILWMQSLGDWLVAPMKFFSFLGTEEFYLLVAPAIYWCIDASLGLRLGLFLMVSGSLNSVLKLVFHGPRPYWYDLSVRALGSETSFGVPSGHAQNAVVVWGAIANHFRTKFAWGICIALIVLIGLSRLFLAVHFPYDVIVGWLIGMVLLWALFQACAPVINWLKKKQLSVQILVSFLASLLIILLGLMIKSALVGWSVPQDWVNNASAVFPDDPINPLALSGLVSNAGAFFGLAAGALWLATRGKLNTHGTWWQLLARYVLGVVGVIAIWFGLGQLFPRGEELLSLSLRYIRYSLVGLWVSALAPFIFQKLKLAVIK